jgi:arylsulfatase A-like enzyme
LLCVGFVRPHVPHVAPQKYFDRFPLEEIELAEILPGDTADCAETLVRDYNYGNGSRDGIENYIQVNKIENGLKRWTQAYLACVAFVDDQIGKVLDALDESSYADNTIIVLASDHGYHMGQKNWLYKHSLWEESTRIPFIWAGPGIAQGEQSNLPTSLIDLYPTMVDLCNLPDNPNQNTNQKKLDGYSLSPVLENPAIQSRPGPDFTLTYVASKTGSVNEVGEVSAPQDHHATIRDQQYRYILCANGEEELYDHRNDPYEWYNLADSAAFNELKNTMKSKLIDFTRRE